jgi:hypothetical protein
MGSARTGADIPDPTYRQLQAKAPPAGRFSEGVNFARRSGRMEEWNGEKREPTIKEESRCL